MLEKINDSAKAPLVISVIFIALFTVAAILWVLKKDYQPLFADMRPEDTAAMIEQLDKLKINYRVNEKTGVLEVPASEVHSTRLKLMGSDASLAGGVGYELFDNSDFGMTEFAQKINYQRALEGELQRTISALDQVRQARVHLVMADRGLFRDKKGSSTASVTLLLQDNAMLNQRQINGIQRLVAASVPELKENMVTISDHNGKPLTQAVPEDQAVQMVPWQLQQKIQAEEYLIGKINKVLSKAFDVNKLSISVDIVMDFSQVKKTEEQIIPVEDGRAVTREKEVRLNNLDTKNQGQNVTREVEYRMGRSVAEITELPGKISKINVGVMLPEALSERSRLEIQRLIEVTAGIDKLRGDSVAIYVYDVPSLDIDGLGEDRQILPITPTPMTRGVPSSSGDSTLQPPNAMYDDLDNSAWTELLTEYRYYLLLILALVAVVLILLASKAFYRKKSVKLTTDEREKVLIQLQHWLSKPK